jgi:hypothetical protein
VGHITRKEGIRSVYEILVENIFDELFEDVVFHERAI